ncbi:MAG: T9SS type A sorting domain-containing protein [candidate division WOR-3 bacterium]
MSIEDINCWDYSDLSFELNLDNIQQDGNDYGEISWSFCYGIEKSIYKLKHKYDFEIANSIANNINLILSLRDDRRGVHSYIDSSGTERTLKTWRGLKYSLIERNDSLFTYNIHICGYDSSLDRFIYYGPSHGIPAKYFAYPDLVLTGRILQTILRFVIAMDTIGKWDEIGGWSYRSKLIYDCKESYNEYIQWFQDTTINNDSYCGAWKHIFDVIDINFINDEVKIDTFYPQYPFRAKMRHPFNKNSTMADAGLFLYELTKENIYLEQTKKFAHYFRNNIDDSTFVFGNGTDSTFLWAYSVNYVKGKADDISHGGLSFIFMNDYHKKFPDDVFGKDDMIKMFNTIKYLMVIPGSETTGNYSYYPYLDGSYHDSLKYFPFSSDLKYQMFKFYGLTEYKPQTFEFITGIIDSFNPEDGYFQYYKRFYTPFSVKIGILPVSVLPVDSQQIETFVNGDRVYVELNSLYNYTGYRDTIVIELYDPDKNAEYHLKDTLYNVLKGITYKIPFGNLVFDGETLKTDTLVVKAYALRGGALKCPFFSDTLPLVARDTVYLFSPTEISVLKNNTFNVYACYRNKNIDLFGIDSVKITITYDTVNDDGSIEKATLIKYTDSNGKAYFNLRTNTTYPVIIRADKLGYFTAVDTLKPFMWSTTNVALGPSSSTHLVKQNGLLHLAYSDGDSIVYGRSKDFGNNWELKKIGSGRDVSITTISGGIAAVWKDGETWQYAYSTSPWTVPLIPTVMGYRSPSILANPANLSQLWFAGITTDHLTIDNQWTLQYTSFMYNNLTIPEFIQLIGEEGELDKNNYLVKPYDFSCIGVTTTNNKLGPEIVFQDANGEIIRKKFDATKNIWLISEKVSNSTFYSFNPDVNLKSFNDTNKIIWQEYNDLHFRNEIYLDNSFKKIVDNVVNDMKYPRIYNSIITYVGDDKLVRINTQEFSNEVENVTLNKGLDSCFYPVLVDSISLSIGLNPSTGQDVYIKNTKIRALWVEGHNNHYKIECGGTNFRIYTDSIYPILENPRSITLTDTLTSISESVLRNFLPSPQSRQPIERLSAQIECLNPAMDYLLEIITTNNNKNQPYALSIEEEFVKLIEGKENRTFFVLDKSDYQDGDIKLNIDRIRGNPNRTINIHLYEYDKIIKDFSATKNSYLQFGKINESVGEFKYKWRGAGFSDKKIEFNFLLPESGLIELKIFNIMGREIYSKKMNGQKGENIIRVDGKTTGLSSGIYFYIFESKYGKERGKIGFIK